MRSLRAVLTGLLASGALFSASAQEYDFYGDAALTGEAVWRESTVLTAVDPDAEPAGQQAEGGWEATGNHTLTFDWGEVRARHRLTAVSAGAGNYEWEHQVYQSAAAFWPGPDWTVTLGRHTLAWGRGYAFFPSDALHPVRTPEGDAPGFDGGSLTWTVNPDWSVTAALRTDRAFQAEDDWWNRLRGGGVLSGYAGGIDAMASVVCERDRLLRGGAGFSADLWGTILTCEGALEFLPGRGARYPRETETGGLDLETRPSGEPVPAVTAGLERTFYPGDHAITFLGEYLYTAAGMNRRQAGRYWDRPVLAEALYNDLVSKAVERGNEPNRQAARERFFPEFLGQQYGYSRFVWDWDERLTWENSALVNIQDGSGRAHHSLTWSNRQALELILRGSWVWGRWNKTEMGILAEKGCIEALVKVFF